VWEQGAEDNSGPKRGEVVEAGEDCIMRRSIIIFMLHKILLW
jgi:hypothetical protein